ncbi:hypothetical protein [Mycobacteroides abscessus]|uniref:hypothetical protein n=1 Tax=Mycobacteroides abscessus TaxID=36809 RepID=UPI0005E108A7|nr:hypothetical protein [Mycobacteroides abscessus]SLI36248.1 Uncharacterised protein [Mycobacteroides abscessus subsp. abscessus]CPR68938.1 Uncharacterised protein [Mycobacteroides abscessus]CPS36772.1 Uncharacterised protein [Mycobacteroides abscessus]CPY32442.1 Uncharacterised protein [Mycobacteroides abscessus]CPY43818.1 Uncharacterised protein [Mycobacteroides abscessus]
MAAPTVADLSAFRGKTVTQEQGAAVLAVVSAMAKAYTRGEGFIDGQPDAAISAVTTTASVRMLANTGQTRFSLTKGPQAAMFDAGFTGWTVAELMVLNSYRVRTK